jgi:hypothetical protein
MCAFEAIVLYRNSVRISGYQWEDIGDFMIVQDALGVIRNVNKFLECLVGFRRL